VQHPGAGCLWQKKLNAQLCGVKWKIKENKDRGNEITGLYGNEREMELRNGRFKQELNNRG
jgi:hypothetical protein